MEKKLCLTVTQEDLLKNAKIAFIDIDGTLRNSNRELENRTIESVKRVVEAGLIVVLTSGRSRTHTENVSKECGASQFVISSNGAEVYDYKRQIEIYLNDIPSKDLICIYKIAEKNNIRMIMNAQKYRFVTHEIDKGENEILLEEDITQFVTKNSIAQCILLDKDFYKMKKLENKIESINDVIAINKSKSLMYPDEPIDKRRTYYDLVKEGTSKGKAIITLANYLNIDISETIGIGDSQNDISMFETVKIPIVMGNANEELKRMGKIVTDTNDNFGVAQILDVIYELKSRI